MLKIDFIEFKDQTERVYRIEQYQVNEFPFIGGAEANLITTKAWNQHGVTFVDSYMESFDRDIIFAIITEDKTDDEIVTMHRAITDVCSPLNGLIQMKVQFTNGSVYFRDIAFTDVPTFPIGFENRNRTWEKVQLHYQVIDPFWYSDHEIIETFQAVDPLFEFPFEMKGYNDSVTSDFKGKVYNSTTENPNKYMRLQSSTLGTPATITTEQVQVSYDRIMNLDGTTQVYTASTNGIIPQNMFSFDAIQILERQFGVAIWEGKTTLAEKVTIANDLITYQKFNWYGYGSSPTGNYAYVTVWYNNTWAAGGVSHTSGTIQKLSRNTISPVVQSDGFIYYIVYTNASDGITPSDIYTDMVDLTLDVTLKNLIAPIQFGTIKENNFAVNEGQVDAPIIIKISGACTNPRIENLTTNEFLKFNNLIMSATDVLEIDTRFGQKKVTLNKSNIFNKLDFASIFFSLKPGANEIKFTDDSGTATASIHFIYRNMYISI